MIYYFTGNGNSRWVAEQLAAATEDDIQNISDYIKAGTMPTDAEQYDRIGIVFPIHTWYAPRPVVDFLSRLSIKADAYCYFVCTCGDDSGKVALRLRKHFKYDAAWSVRMPNTYIPMFDLDSDTIARLKVKDAKEDIGYIARDINERKKKVKNIFEGAFPFTKTYIINPLFYRFIVSSKGFTVSDTCISCGTCRDVCPVGNIKLVEGRPQWDSDCIHCMACIHSCPQRSIDYRQNTKKRGRYRLKRYIG